MSNSFWNLSWDREVVPIYGNDELVLLEWTCQKRIQIYDFATLYNHGDYDTYCQCGLDKNPQARKTKLRT